MDLSKVEKDENKRQQMIKDQPFGGIYNPLTGVYKFTESIVYDLTKTGGLYGLGWLPMRSPIIEYKSPQKTKK